MFGINFFDVAVYFFPIIFIVLFISKILFSFIKGTNKVCKVLETVRYTDIGTFGLLACLAIFLRILEIHSELDVHVWVLPISEWCLFPLNLLFYCVALNLGRVLYANKLISAEEYVKDKKSVTKYFLFLGFLSVLVLILAIGLEY